MAVRCTAKSNYDHDCAAKSNYDHDCLKQECIKLQYPFFKFELFIRLSLPLRVYKYVSSLI